jgi:hypothetical protein
MATDMEPQTDEQLAAQRADALAYMQKNGWPSDTKFTCDTCDQRRTCPFAYDPYNTGGDCLAAK